MRTDRPPAFWPTLLGYLLVRLLLTAALAALIWGAAAVVKVDMPLLIAAMLGLIVQLPMAWLLFPGMQNKVATALQARSGQRQQLRAELQAALDDHHDRDDDRDDGDDDGADDRDDGAEDRALPRNDQPAGGVDGSASSDGTPRGE